MKLHIEWFAKISSADIEFDGMTVIAGKNNTGKSTVGKVLYAFFRSMSQLEKRVRRDRLSSIMRAFKKATDFSISESQAESLLVGSVTERRLYDDMLGALPDYERNMRMLALPGFSAADERKLAAEISSPGSGQAPTYICQMPFHSVHLSRCHAHSKEKGHPDSRQNAPC